jgi:hypothetical protein
LFEKKTVLFMGYGLEEIEVLEYILKQGGAIETINRAKPRIRRFIVQGFFDADKHLFDFLYDYYRESFESELIAFPKDHKDHEQLVELIRDWAKSLAFKRLELADQAERLEDEIRG